VRALLITDWLGGTGGAEAYMAAVRDGLRAAGDEVRLLTSTAGSAGDGAAEYRAYGSERMAARALLQLANPFALLAVRAALREFRPDVVLVNMYENQLSPAILGRLRHVPAVLSVTDYKPICPVASKLLPSGRLCADRAGLVCLRAGCVSLPHWLRDQPRYALIRAGQRHFDRVLACSRWVQRELASNGLGSEHLTLPVAPPGAGFRRVPAAEPLFVYCGRLEATKGVATLLRAFARTRTESPAARLRIVGRGAERGSLERLVQSLGLEGAVTFRGWVPPAEVERELADAWALVVPSLWAEPLGLVAVEAIVRGVPVIASASGGLGEVVAHGVSGLLFPNGDDAALAEHMRAIASGDGFPSHALPEAVVERTREAHSLSRHVERLRGVFGEITAPGRVRTAVSDRRPAATTSSPP
jgi:glycosyltransferase involved in cell wall biosynthesis